MVNLMTKDQVAAALLEIGTLLELRGENRFKVNAYLNGAFWHKTFPIILQHLKPAGKA